MTDRQVLLLMIAGFGIAILLARQAKKQLPIMIAPGPGEPPLLRPSINPDNPSPAQGIPLQEYTGDMTYYENEPA